MFMANELTVVMSNNKATISSRQISEYLGSEHRNILRSISLLNCSQEFKAENFIESTYVDQMNRAQPECLMTSKGVHVLLGFIRSPKTIAVMEMCANAFERMENELRNRNSPIQTINLNNRVEVALKLSDLYKEIAVVEEKRQELEVKIKIDAPKVQFAEAISASETDISVGDFSKILYQNGIKTGQNRLFKWFRENGYLIAFGERYNMPKQRFIESGLFHIREVTGKKNEKPVIFKMTMVTPKGQNHFLDMFLDFQKKGQLMISSDGTNVDQPEEKPYQKLGFQSTAKKDLFVNDATIATVKRYLNIKVPDNWNKMPLKERREYIQAYDDNADVCGSVRTHVSNAEIWCECLGKDLSSLKTYAHTLSEIMNRIGGWDRQYQKQIYIPIYGSQVSYTRT